MIRVLCAAALVGSVACGGSTSSSGGGGERGALGALDRIDSPELIPQRKAARVYRSDPLETRQLAALRDSLRAAILQRVQRKALSARVRVISDERLDRVAADLARTVGANELPRSEAVSFLLGYYGVVEPYPEMSMSRVHSKAPEDKIVAHVTSGISLPKNSSVVTMGIGVSRVTTRMTIVVALQGKHIDLKPVARKQPAGARVELRGALLGEFRTPSVHVTNPKGSVDQYLLQVQDHAFFTKVSCDSGDGEYQVEVFGEDDAGPRVLANFPIYCGAEPPNKLGRSAGFVPTPISASAAEAALLVAINRSRKAAGLPALKADTKYAAVARAHSADMLANQYIAHISPTTGSPSDRLKASGIAMPNRLLENIGTASSVDEVHNGLMRSPGHRSAILDRHTTHVGIGVVVSQPKGRAFTIVATELFR